MDGTRVIFDLAMGLFYLAMAFCGWGLYVNDQTYRDRQAILEVVFDRSRGFYDRHLDLLNRVPYDTHANYRLWLRDPWQLYPDEVVFAAKGVRYPHD